MLLGYNIIDAFNMIKRIKNYKGVKQMLEGSKTTNSGGRLCDVSFNFKLNMFPQTSVFLFY